MTGHPRLPPLTPSIIAGCLANSRAAQRPLLLLLDYDGTLVPIAPTPEQARPSRRLLALLAKLAAHPEQRVVVVSGRPLAQLRQLLPVPGLWLSGDHGGNVAAPDGRVHWLLEPAALAPVLAGLSQATRRLLGQAPGFHLELKDLSLALHYRLAPEPEAEAMVRTVRALWQTVAAQCDLSVLRGKCVIELRSRGVHKGNACGYLLGLQPGALGIYLGDDLTDEDAFRVVVSAGGLAVLVGRRRPTAAQYHLAAQGEVEPVLGYLTRNFQGAREGLR